MRNPHAILDAPYQRVKEETLKYVQDLGADGDWTETWQAGPAVARRGFGHDTHWDAGDKFFNQVTRALNDLAVEGRIKKLGKGYSWPHGPVLTNPVFMTHEVYDAELARREQEHQEWLARQNRWDQVVASLRSHGIEVSRTRPHAPTMPLEAWGQIVEKIR